MPIVLDNITVSYHSVPAVHHAYARFETGSTWAIFGPNGAGKSTLLKAVMRLLPCDTGQVHWQGLARRDLAYLPQQSEIDRTLPLTVFELVALGLWHELGLFGGLNAPQRERVHQALQRVGMSAHAGQQIGALSTGQFQRVLFARMLVQDARFLLLDEPFSAMDAQTTHALLNVLHTCVAAGKGVIAVVHDREQALQHFTHTLLLAREVIASGLSAEVLTPACLQQAAGFRQDPDTRDEWCTAQPDPDTSGAHSHAAAHHQRHDHLHDHASPHQEH